MYLLATCLYTTHSAIHKHILLYASESCSNYYTSGCVQSPNAAAVPYCGCLWEAACRHFLRQSSRVLVTTNGQISAHAQQASSIEDIPGQPQALQGKVLEAAEGAIQQFSPFSRIHQHVCGFHFYAHDITRQVIPTFPRPVLLNPLVALLLPLRPPLDGSLEDYSSAGSYFLAFGIPFLLQTPCHAQHAWVSKGQAQAHIFSGLPQACWCMLQQLFPYAANRH